VSSAPSNRSSEPADGRDVSATTVVSITPQASQRDSRAGRIAASFGRLGFRSVLCEGLRSTEPPDTALYRVRSIRLRVRDGRRASKPRRLGSRVFDLVVGPWLRVPRADLYYLHSSYQYPGFALRNLFRRAPFVYDAHDFYSGLADADLQPAWQRRLELRIERACIRRAAATVTVSDGVADLYEERFGRRPTVLHNAHDPRLDHEPATTIRAAVGVGGDELLVVLIGQWKAGATPLKVVVRAVARSDEHVHVVFVGDGFPDGSRSLVERAGVADRVHFLPSVEPSEIVPFVGTADAGAVLYRPINASVAACLPNGFYQVVAAGLPVVYGLDLPMVAALAKDIGLGVDGSDPEAIAGAFDRLASDERLRQQLRDAARRRSGELVWSAEEGQLDVMARAALSRDEPAPRASC